MAHKTDHIYFYNTVLSPFHRVSNKPIKESIERKSIFLETFLVNMQAPELRANQVPSSKNLFIANMQVHNPERTLPNFF
jgi:hypothetical protein